MNNSKNNKYSHKNSIDEITNLTNLLMESEERFLLIIEQSPLSISIYKPDGSLYLTNTAYAKLWNLSKQQVKEAYKKYNLLQDKQAKELGFSEILEDVFKGKSSKHIVEYDSNKTMGRLKIAGAKGNKRTIQQTLFPLKINKNEIANIVMISEDITERIKIEQSLKENEEKYKSIFNNANDIIFLIKDEIIVEVNKRAEEIFGKSREKLININPWDPSITPKFFANGKPSKEFGRKQLAESIKRKTDTFNWEHLRKDGTLFYVEVSLRMIILKGEEFAHAIVRDITEKVRSEQLLKQNERKFVSIFENANDAILILKDEKIIECNQQTCTMFGRSKNKLLGLKPWESELSPNAQPNGELSIEWGPERIEQVLSGTRNKQEWTHKKADGTKFNVEISLTSYETKGEQFTHAILRDITDRKQAEQELNNAYNEIKTLKDKLQAENIYLRQTVEPSNLHQDIVGNSPQIKETIAKALQVASTDSNVLIWGETGTGKELISKGIHDASDRKGKTLVAVNCAAIPDTLIESELFGHERGAFTGAEAKKIGLFEIADKSTIFLDEIGEMPLNVQSKLLRVLEEMEITRIGSTKPIKIDVRLIAATNQDLEHLVKEKKFRQDLFYRLNVFPIELPPLRIRKQDIKLLVEKFVEDFNQHMGKKVSSISKKTLEALEKYAWPGNVRELKNIVERSMIGSTGNTLILDIKQISNISTDKELTTLKDYEHNYIKQVLEMTYWKISGEGGAAEILGLNRNTLNSKIKKLGIRKH